jgi:acylphosphatase
LIQNNTDNSDSNSNKKENSDSSDYIRVHLIISGKVQGVYFRKHTQDTSRENNVYGWVKNLMNGNVECVLEGLKSNVDKVIIWCHQGPSNSHVDNVEIKYEKFTGHFTDFQII